MSEQPTPGNSAVAFLFPGQGSQTVGMGKQLAALYPVARQTFDEADAALGYKLSELCFEGPEERLRMTEVTQPALLTVSLAAWRVLREKGITAGQVAGHSLGEWSAHVAAGTLAFADAVRAVRNRGRYMQEAVPAGQGAMAAILGMPLAQVEEVCAEARAGGLVVSPANLNSPDQIVISGHRLAVERAAELARRRGAKRAVMLEVSAPFHCALMQPAQERLAAELKVLPMSEPSLPVAANFDGEMKNTAAAARDALLRQVTGAVRWEKCVRALIANGARVFVEVGAGRVLCGLLRQIDRSQTCFGVEDEPSLEKLVSHFA